MLIQKKLKNILNYDLKTGIFTWKISNSNRVKIGDISGWVTKNGYINININNKTYGAHRLAWLYVNGYIPKYIDHIDKNKSNNKIINLRECSNQENSCNTKISKNNTTGYRGVFHIKNYNRLKKWSARITVNYKCISLGYYLTQKEAAIAYDKAAIKYHKKFASLNFNRRNYE